MHARSQDEIQENLSGLAAADEACRAVQDAVLKASGRKGPANSFLPDRPTGRQVRGDGIVYVNDISYSATLPNSFFDVWYASPDAASSKPTVVYFHGGGFLFGDKADGDPLAVQSADETSLLVEFVKNGFNVVSANYAFAPEHRYPTQIHQMNELLTVLIARSKSLGLDADNLILAGSSAGANMVEIFSLAVFDAQYAAQIGVAPGLKPEQLKCVVVDESALTVMAMDEPNIQRLTQTWLGVENPQHDEVGRQVNVPAHLRSTFPPSFINSSNMESLFITSATDLHHALDKLGIPNELFLVDAGRAALEHGYVNRFTSDPDARECLDRMIHFMKRFTAAHEPTSSTSSI